jgi:hypothetical protein
MKLQYFAYVFLLYYSFKIGYALKKLLELLFYTEKDINSSYFKAGILYNSLYYGTISILIFLVYLTLCWYLNVDLRSKLFKRLYILIGGTYIIEFIVMKIISLY